MTTTRTPLDEIDNDDLIHVPFGEYTDAQYADELARIDRIQVANVTTGLDLTYWYDRENHIREMQTLAEATRHVKGVKFSDL